LKNAMRNDWDGTYLGYPSFRIAFFNGTTYTTYLSVPMSGLLSLNTKYRIKFSSWPNFNLPNRSWLEASIETASATLLASIGPLSVPGFAETSVAGFGMHTYRAATTWSYFSLDNIPAP